MALHRADWGRVRLGGPFLRDYFLSRTGAIHAARTIPALARCASAMRPVRHFSDRANNCHFRHRHLYESRSFGWRRGPASASGMRPFLIFLNVSGLSPAYNLKAVTIPTRRHNKDQITLKPVTGWTIQLARKSMTLLTFEYLEAQEGVNRTYKHTIQLGFSSAMCQELGDALTKIVKARLIPVGTQVLESRQ